MTNAIIHKVYHCGRITELTKTPTIAQSMIASFPNSTCNDEHSISPEFTATFVQAYAYRSA